MQCEICLCAAAPGEILVQILALQQHGDAQMRLLQHGLLGVGTAGSVRPVDLSWVLGSGTWQMFWHNRLGMSQ